MTISATAYQSAARDSYNLRPGYQSKSNFVAETADTIITRGGRNDTKWGARCKHCGFSVSGKFSWRDLHRSYAIHAYDSCHLGYNEGIKYEDLSYPMAEVIYTVRAPC